MHVNVAHVLPRSTANGPGERFVLWVQGCGLRCPGCWNPGTWSRSVRELVSVRDLSNQVLATAGIEGITLTGGEPFDQAAALQELCQGLRSRGLSVVAFPVYRYEALAHPTRRGLRDLCDVIVAGPYQRDLRLEGEPLRGSSNQVVRYLTDRYAFDDAPQTVCEFHLGGDGEVRVTGFPTRDLIEAAGGYR